MKKGKGASFAFYLALSYALLVIVGLTVFGLYWFSQEQAATEDALLTQLRERARMLSLLSQSDNLPERVAGQQSVEAGIDGNLRAVLVTTDLQVHRISDLELSEAQRQEVLALASQALAGQSYARADSQEEGQHRSLYAAAPIYTPEGRVKGAVCLVLPLDSFQAYMSHLRMELFEFAALLAGTGLLLGVLLATVFTRPLSRAGRMASRIAGGDYSVRLATQGPRELSELADHFNKMAEKLEAQDRSRSQILANITHELGRPLGALKLGVDSLRGGALQDPELTQDMLAEISRTLERMENQVQDLAIAARPQEAHLQLELAPVEPKKFLDHLYSRFHPLAENRGIEFLLEIAPHLPAMLADETRLDQVMSNLVDNALKFTPSRGKVTLSARREGPWIELGVLDSGPGIPREELAELFKPFTRGSNAPHTLQGMGLGLSIVRRLVEAHGGKVSMENVPGEGLLVRVLLTPVENGAEDPSVADGQASAEADSA